MNDALIRCGRCGTTKAEHRLVNFADGPMVGEPALICPTAVFLDIAKRAAEAATGANAGVKQKPDETGSTRNF